MANQSTCCPRISLALLLICVWGIVLATRENDNTCSDEGSVCTEKVNIENEHPQCQLYLAPSSIPNAGIGVYTSVHFKKGDHVGENDLLIPIINLSEYEEWLIDDVQWGLDLDPRLYNEDANAESVGVYMSGFGAQINCHFGLNNIGHQKPRFDSAGLHRSKDPGVGAFTYWYDMPNFASRDIQPGEELFTNYGAEWFETRADLMGEIPVWQDFDDADRIVRKIQAVEAGVEKTRKHAATSHPTNETLALNDTWEVVLNSSKQALRRALPPNYKDLEEAIQHGTARHSVGGLSSIRSQEWLLENGMCIDHIYVNASNIPQAGRGAFAKRFMSKGSIVSPAPVLQLRKGLLLNEPAGFGLLFNYVFGHPESSIVLLPYSSTVNFINHDSMNPNVELRWSSSPLHRKEYLNLSSKEVLKQSFGLMMEFVSLRDIQPDEEILLDYGINWEGAWKKHVDQWQPIPGSENFKTAEEAMETMGILTLEEQKSNPYPANVRTECNFQKTEDTIYENITDPSLNVNPSYRVKWRPQNRGDFQWCDILYRHNTTTTSVAIYYDALILPRDNSNEETLYIYNIPADAIALVDKELSRDQYLPNTFRHYIQLSDDVFPESWKGNKTKVTSEERKVFSDQCELYIAQSSIPNAGIGVYTAVDYKNGDYIGEGEMLIPVLTTVENWLVDDVEWGLDLDERLYYEDGKASGSIFYPGFGAAVNCHFGLNNAEHNKPKFDAVGLHRSKDPGVGAFTNWYDMPNIATRDIQSGEELFVDYGYGWFTSRVNLMGDIPTDDEFLHADRIVRKMHALSSKNITTIPKRMFKNKNDLALEDIWGFLCNVSNQALERALPPRYGDLDEVLKHGSARHSVGGESSIRSHEWLNKNGICVDHLYVNVSTIPQAGRGAFAKRFIPKDSVVSPAPVLQLNRAHFYHQSKGFELLFNYAYGHPDSPIFLLPYSSTVNFINHDSRRPNVKLRWSTSPLHRKDYLDLSTAEVLKQGFGLMMEFISLRDIHPHEEILFDYGGEWERAWQNHVADWSPVPGAESYMTADEVRQTIGILTIEEQKAKSYPNNVRTACFFSNSEDTFYKNITKEGDLFKTFRVDQWKSSNDDCLRWCTILERRTRNGNDALFDVLIEPQTAHLLEECVLPSDEKIYVNNVPSNKVTLVDVEHSRDQNLPNAFRHFIRLPDDLYPDAWRQNRTK